MKELFLICKNKNMWGIGKIGDMDGGMRISLPGVSYKKGNN